MHYLDFLTDKSVLVTGHSGFKGSWLVEFLLRNNIRVSGVSLPPESNYCLHNLLRHHIRMDQSHYLDILDLESLERTVRSISPDFVFHLAAQPLVHQGYKNPLNTWNVNVIGTLNLLESLRKLANPSFVVVVTTDKVYKNQEWDYSYRENDLLGGVDPYSASKAACELVVSSWHASYSEDSGVYLSTVRAGNVLGPGDYSPDRIVPDCYRAWSEGSPVILRYPYSTRPWQHVFEPLWGYLLAARSLAQASTTQLESFNFGPSPIESYTVLDLVKALSSFGDSRHFHISKDLPLLYESSKLKLSIDYAFTRLSWRPLLSFEQLVKLIDDGYTSTFESLPAILANQLDFLSSLI
jgi:CDP-glucose 4,6-dehydratase